MVAWGGVTGGKHGVGAEAGACMQSMKYRTWRCGYKEGFRGCKRGLRGDV